MKAKTKCVLYWALTGLLCLVNFGSGVAELFPSVGAYEVMALLGYPFYLLTILGIAKIAGSIAMIQNKYKVVKEWAYAGFAIDYVCAGLSFYFVQGLTSMVVGPLVFFVLLMISHRLWKQLPMAKGG